MSLIKHSFSPIANEWQSLSGKLCKVNMCGRAYRVRVEHVLKICGREFVECTWADGDIMRGEEFRSTVDSIHLIQVLEEQGSEQG